MQFTVRGVPREVDAALRRMARVSGRSLNALLVDSLREKALPDPRSRVVHHDLDFLFGTWVPDPEFDAAIREQQSIDPEMWK